MKLYLSDDEIKKVAVGFEYKKKSIGGSVFFKKEKILIKGKLFIVEIYSKNNVWALDENELNKIAKFAEIRFLEYVFLKSNNLIKCRVFAKTNDNNFLSAVGSASTRTVRPNVHRNEMESIAKHRAKLKLLKKIVDFNEVKADTHFFPVIIPEKKKNLNFRTYEKLYENYSDPEELNYFDLDSPEYIRIKNILPEIKPELRVLDIGCNSGFIGKKVMEKNCVVYGIDINKKLLKKAKKKGLIVKKAFAEKIPFQNNFFHCAMMGYLLEHVLNPNKVLSEASRVLMSEGKLIGSVPTEFGDWGKHNYKIHSEHLRCYNMNMLRKSLQNAGFKSIKIKKEFYEGRDIADSYFFTAKKRE
ncbi:MAG: class I SAM-dependent methyltransferase [archaeon]|nr:class I SAM-dependent methyltransferase [archaeon]